MIKWQFFFYLSENTDKEENKIAEIPKISGGIPYVQTIISQIYRSRAR